MRMVKSVLIGLVLMFACASCAVPPELAIIMGEWRGEESDGTIVYFKLTEYGDIECDDRPWHENVLYGFLSFRDRFMDGEEDELLCEDSTYYTCELSGDLNLPAYYATAYPSQGSYYFDLVSLDTIKGYGPVRGGCYEDEDGQMICTDVVYQFTANRVRR